MENNLQGQLFVSDISNDLNFLTVHRKQYCILYHKITDVSLNHRRLFLIKISLPVLNINKAMEYSFW